MRWWVAFMDTPDDDTGWWNAPKYEGVWTKPGFRHCIVYRQLPGGALLIVEPMRGHLDVRVREGWVYAANRDIIRDFNGTVVVFDSPSEPPEFPMVQYVTCASVLGYMLGIGRRVLGPLELHRALLALGGSELPPEDFGLCRRS